MNNSERLIMLDDNISNSDWTKANAFDFPNVETVEDFEREFGVPKTEPARTERLKEWAKFPWAKATPAPIYELLFGVQKMRLADVIKASFGGDRSEAGRYAANIRWQGNVKGETKPKVNLSEDQLKAIARINEATKYVKSKGFTVEKFNGADGEKSKELANTYYRQLKAIQKRKNEEFLEYRRSRPKRQDYDSFKAWQKAISEHNEKIKLQSREDQGISVFKQILEKINYNSEELSSKEASKYADIYVLRDSKGVIAAIGSATTATVSTGGPTMLIEWIGSAQVVKGAGSALWGAMVKSHSLQNGYSISFDVADNAVPFWSTMGLEIQTVNGTASLKNVKDFAEELE